MSIESEQPPLPLGVWDMASLIVGIVVGTAIFRASPDVFGQFSSPWSGLLVWALGGMLAFCGALCYSELTTAYTDFGAEYVFLGKAYGRPMGFLFAWMQTCIILPGSVGAMSFVFVDYFNKVVPIPVWSQALVAIGAVLVLLLLQLAGLRTGKFVQNLLTTCKILALVGLLLVGLTRTPHPNAFGTEAVAAATHTVTSTATNVAPPGTTGTGTTTGTAETTESATAPAKGSFSFALILVMFAYAGWNDATAVAPEVRDAQRNLPRALLYGLGFIVLLYLAVNAAYLNVLGFVGVQSSRAPAADLIAHAWGQEYAWGMSVVVMISALGAIHGTMFAGSRLLAAVGRDYPLFSPWKQWNARGAPVWSLITLASISTALTLLAGTQWGLNCLQWLARPLGFQDQFDPEKGFDLLVSTASPVFFLFFMLTGLGLIVLRFRDPLRPRPFKVPYYPLTPLVLVCVAGFMCYSGFMYVKLLMLLSLPPLLVGIILACFIKPTPTKAL